MTSLRKFMLSGQAEKKMKAMLAGRSSFPGFLLVSQFTESSFRL
jgi:hypothetical protein